MENRLRSQRYNQIFLQALKVVFVFLVWMSVIRYLFYFLARGSLEFIEPTVIQKAFLVGFRFDLLVWGFLLLPIVVFLPALLFIFPKWEMKAIRVMRFYLGLAWVGVVMTAIISLPHYLTKGRHFRLSENSPILVWPNWDLVTSALVGFIFLFLIIGGIKTIRQQSFYAVHQFLTRKFSIPAVEVLTRLLLPVVLVGLAARGTLEPHHLAKEHSEISPWEAANELSLNAAWCLDK